MNIVKDLAPIVAQGIIKDWVKELDTMSVIERVNVEVPGLDENLIHNLTLEVEELIKRASVNVWFEPTLEEIEEMNKSF